MNIPIEYLKTEDDDTVLIGEVTDEDAKTEDSREIAAEEHQPVWVSKVTELRIDIPAKDASMTSPDGIIGLRSDHIRQNLFSPKKSSAPTIPYRYAEYDAEEKAQPHQN